MYPRYLFNKIQQQLKAMLMSEGVSDLSGVVIVDKCMTKAE